MWKIVPLSPTRHLHRKAIIMSLRVIEDLSNTHKQKRDKNLPQMKEKEKSPEKIIMKLKQPRYMIPRYMLQNLKQWL